MARGGARTPANPAPVGMPGALSVRTDGGPGQPVRDPGGLPYGENTELRTVQGSAPMSKSNVPATAVRGNGGGQTGAALVPFNAPTQRPGEPVTTGNPRGAGAGPEVLQAPMGYAKSNQSDADSLKQYLPVLEQAAAMPDVPATFVKFVHFLRNQ